MAFTDRFLKLPVEIYNRSKQAELLGKDDDEEGFPSTMKILPLEIQSYHPAFDKDNEPEGKTIAYFKGEPQGIKVLMTVEQFEKALNEFMK